MQTTTLPTFTKNSFLGERGSEWWKRKEDGEEGEGEKACSDQFVHLKK